MKKIYLLLLIIIFPLQGVNSAVSQAQTIDKMSSELHSKQTKGQEQELASAFQQQTANEQNTANEEQQGKLKQQQSKFDKQQSMSEMLSERSPSQVALMIIGLMVALAVLMFNQA